MVSSSGHCKAGSRGRHGLESRDRRQALAVPDMLTITEIFHSIQGESTFAGLPCVFVRLTACDLRCAWCDTAYAFTEGTKVTLEDVLREVQAYGCPLVEITGGEPLLQDEVYPLMERLLAGGGTSAARNRRPRQPGARAWGRREDRRREVPRERRVGAEPLAQPGSDRRGRRGEVRGARSGRLRLRAGRHAVDTGWPNGARRCWCRRCTASSRRGTWRRGCSPTVSPRGCSSRCTSTSGAPRRGACSSRIAGQGQETSGRCRQCRPERGTDQKPR